MSADDLSPDSRPALSGQLRQPERTDGHPLRNLGLLAIAFSLIWIAGIAYISTPASVALLDTRPAPPLRQVSLPVHQSKPIRLLFDFAQDLPGATVSVSLPPNVELDGFPNQQTVSWSADIRSGENALVLPLRGLEISSGELQAEIRHNHKIITVRLKLDVKQGLEGQPHPTFDRQLRLIET